MITFVAALVAVAVAVAVVARLFLFKRSVVPPAPPAPPVFVPEAAEGTTPRFGSRRWARMLYHNNLIDLEELNAFYAQHPEKLSDPDR